MLSRGRILAAAMSVAVIGWSSASTNAGDLFGILGHGGAGCSTCGRAYVPQHVPQMIPVPMQYYQGPTMQIVRQIPGEPPEPAPKWARPPGTVPVIAIQEPPPRWVHPAALAANAQPGLPPAAATQYATPLAATTVSAYPTRVQAAGLPMYNQAAVGQAQLGQIQVGQVQMPANNGLLLAQNGQPVAAAGLTPVAVPVNPRNGNANAATATNASQSNPAAGNAAGRNAGNAAQGNAGIAPKAAAQGSNGTTTLRGNLIVPVNPGSIQQPLIPQPMQSLQGQYLPAAPTLGAVPQQQARPPIRTAPNVARYQAFSDKPGPPPGTLGKTYQRPSRLIAWDKHPRIGMLDVEVLDSVRVGLAHDVKIKVITQDIYNNNKPLEGFFGEDNVWHFESDPLLPLVPHIYDVRFELVRERRIQEMRYGRMFERIKEDKLGNIGVRRVRLVPGRIVDLVLY